MITRSPSQGARPPEAPDPGSGIVVSPKGDGWSWRHWTALALVISAGAYFIATASVTALLIAGTSVVVILAALTAVMIWVQNNVDWC